MKLVSRSSAPVKRAPSAVKPQRRTGARLFFHKLRLLAIALWNRLRRAARRTDGRRAAQAIALAALCVVLVVIEAKIVRLNAPARAAVETERAAEDVSAQPILELSVAATDDTKPENLIREETIIVDGVAVDNYSFDAPIRFSDGADYADLPGILAFRGNNYRNGASYGTTDVTDGALSIAWDHTSSALQAPDGEVWTGSGWTGQPLIVTWPKSTRAVMNMAGWAKEADTLTEVVYATMDGHVYFFELETGKATRDPIFLGFTFKGAGSLDPRGYPILYVGAGYNGARGAGRAFAVSLIDGEILYEFGAADGYAHRQTWTMFDASPLVSADTDQLIYPGESGILYIIKLNTAYDEAKGTLTMTPDEPVRWRYEGTRTGAQFWVGVESSPVVWNHYLYMADNGGNLMCMDLDTLKLVWVQDVLDDTNCTPVLECEDGRPYLYISTSFHAGWRASENSTAVIPVWKIDALDGSVVWQHDYTCYTQSGVSGGVQGTIACGKNSLSDLVFVPVARCGDQASAGVLAALDKQTGETVWEFKTPMYSWSSPVDFYDGDGNGYLIYPTSGGYLYLLDGKTGEKLDAIDLKGNIEASAAVFNDMVVVGHRSQKIYGIQVS